MRNTVQFAGQSFDDIWPDPEGDIPIAVAKKGLCGFSVRAGVKSGCSYTPGNHPYPVTVKVIKGTGSFFLKEEVLEYWPGSVFEVGAYVPHSFIKVVRDTIFIKDIPDATRV